MALIKPSALVSEFKGVLSGSILQTSPFGNVIRNRKSGSAPVSSYFGSSQSLYSSVIRLWKDVTVANKTLWDAAGLLYSFSDKFGNAYNPSGYQLFCTLNFVRVSTGQSPFSAPPTQRTPTDTGKITPATNYTNSLTVTWTTAGTSNEFLRIYASPMLSQGVFRYPRTMFWLTDVVSGASTQVNVWTEYIARFGTPSSGQGRIFFKSLNYDQRECLLIQPNYEYLTL